MKRVLIFLSFFILSLALCACNPGEITPEGSESTTTVSSVPLDPGCQHAFANATCTQPKYCKYCGGTEGEPAPHSWQGPFCNLPEHCGMCGTRKSEELGDHKWLEANCSRGKQCEYCGTIEGSPNDVHDWVLGDCVGTEVCLRCGMLNGTPKGEHKWMDATCIEPKTCYVCNLKEGSPSNVHIWADANCGYPKMCATCGKTDGFPVGEHKWEAANCLNPKTCSVCRKMEGDPNGEHVWHAADCAPKRCEICAIQVGESAGLPHTWVGGSCTKLQHCSVCSAVGDYKHKFNEQFKCTFCKYYEFSYGLSYELNGDEYTVTGIGSCTDTHIKIPETYKGKPVTAIAKRAFYKDNPFAITLPKTIKHIGMQAIVGPYHVYYESTLEDWINIKKDHAMVKEDPGVTAVAICGSYKLYLQGKLLETLVIPESITEIPDCAFACMEIKKIVLHDKITKIGVSAFAEVGYLVTDPSLDPNTWRVEISIPDSVKEIGDFGFQSLKVDQIVIPESVTKVGVYAFNPISTIYCESNAKPAGWDNEWMGFYEPGYYRNIYWKGQWESMNGVPIPKK